MLRGRKIAIIIKITDCTTYANEVTSNNGSVMGHITATINANLKILETGIIVKIKSDVHETINMNENPTK